MRRGDIFLAGALDASPAVVCVPSGLCFLTSPRRLAIMLLFGYMSPWDTASSVAPGTNAGPMMLWKSAFKAHRA